MYLFRAKIDFKIFSGIIPIGMSCIGDCWLHFIYLLCGLASLCSEIFWREVMCVAEVQSYFWELSKANRETGNQELQPTV